MTWLFDSCAVTFSGRGVQDSINLRGLTHASSAPELQWAAWFATSCVRSGQCSSFLTAPAAKELGMVEEDWALNALVTLQQLDTTSTCSIAILLLLAILKGLGYGMLTAPSSSCKPTQLSSPLQSSHHTMLSHTSDKPWADVSVKHFSVVGYAKIFAATAKKKK